MEKKNISNFQEFECNVTSLDKIYGGYLGYERVSSGVGTGVGGKPVREYLHIFPDDTYLHEYVYTE